MLEPGRVTEADIQDLYDIALAQIRYLQDEYGCLHVSGVFDKDTTKLFRSFRNNTSGLSPEAIEDLRKAASITASRPQSQNSRPPPRGRYNQRGQNNFPRGNNSSIYNQFTSRSVPAFPPRRGGLVIT